MLLVLYHVVFNSFFTIPLAIENMKLKLAISFPIDAPITLANQAIETPPLVADKTIEELSK